MGGGESGSEGSSANLLEASFLLASDSLDVPSEGFRNPRGSLNRKSPAQVSRLRLGTGGTDGVRVLGSGNPPRSARRGRGAAGGERSPQLLGVCSIRLNTLELPT